MKLLVSRSQTHVMGSFYNLEMSPICSLISRAPSNPYRSDFTNKSRVISFYGITDGLNLFTTRSTTGQTRLHTHTQTKSTTHRNMRDTPSKSSTYLMTIMWFNGDRLALGQNLPY